MNASTSIRVRLSDSAIGIFGLDDCRRRKELGIELDGNYVDGTPERLASLASMYEDACGVSASDYPAGERRAAAGAAKKIRAALRPEVKP